MRYLVIEDSVANTAVDVFVGTADIRILWLTVCNRSGAGTFDIQLYKENGDNGYLYSDTALGANDTTTIEDMEIPAGSRLVVNCNQDFSVVAVCEDL